MIIKGFILLIADPLAKYFNIYDLNNNLYVRNSRGQDIGIKDMKKHLIVDGNFQHNYVEAGKLYADFIYAMFYLN